MINDDEEFEERAAIREFEGNVPRGQAEFFAREEVLARKAQQGCLNRKKQNKQSQQNEPRKIQQPKQQQPRKKEKLQSLQDQLEEIGKKMRAEKDSKRKNELFIEWNALVQKIIDVRKGA